MSKNVKGLGEAPVNQNLKGYLKPTLSSKQAQRQVHGLPPLAQEETRAQTAPTNIMGLRTASQKSRGGGIQGMTLQDYANTNSWGQGAAPTITTRQSTAPCWRKTKQQRVDEKILKLEQAFAESQQNEQAKKIMIMSETKKNLMNVQKYFPWKEVPLGQKQEE